jgi:hypothetical protein
MAWEMTGAAAAAANGPKREAKDGEGPGFFASRGMPAPFGGEQGKRSWGRSRCGHERRKAKLISGQQSQLKRQ